MRIWANPWVLASMSSVHVRLPPLGGRHRAWGRLAACLSHASLNLAFLLWIRGLLPREADRMLDGMGLGRGML
jgi:hypothetical protein